MKKHIGLVTALACCALPLFGQCEGKTGFALQACQAQNGQNQANNTNAPGSVKSDLLTTSFSDSIHSNTLPAGLDLTTPKPLDKLERSDDGSFELVAGVYEENVESFSLDAGTVGFSKGGDLFPAPIKGTMGRVIAQVLKLAELHPEILHDDIQQLLTGLMMGTNLGKMSPQAQKAAAMLLTKDQIVQLHPAPSASKEGGDSKMTDWLKKQAGSVIGAGLGKAQNKVNQADQKAGMPGAITLPTTPTTFPQGNQAAVSSGYPMPQSYQMAYGSAFGKGAGGVWVQMNDGYYLRYVPEAMGSVKIQLIVPDAVVAAAKGHPILFDPTLLIAVSGGYPGHRLGITMRTVGQHQ